MSEVLQLWHKGMGYAKGAVDNFPVDLLFRLATTADLKQVSKQTQQVWYGYLYDIHLHPTAKHQLLQPIKLCSLTFLVSSALLAGQNVCM